MTRNYQEGLKAIFRLVQACTTAGMELSVLLFARAFVGSGFGGLWSSTGWFIFAARGDGVDPGSSRDTTGRE
jgi:hypothetical protein